MGEGPTGTLPVMDTKHAPAVNDDAQLAELARSLDCFTEAELRKLGRLTQNTTEAWRKRGKGPAYVLFGNRYYYPRKAVADHFATLVRERHSPAAASAL